MPVIPGLAAYRQLYAPALVVRNPVEWVVAGNGPGQTRSSKGPDRRRSRNYVTYMCKVISQTAHLLILVGTIGERAWEELLLRASGRSIDALTGCGLALTRQRGRNRLLEVGFRPTVEGSAMTSY